MSWRSGWWVLALAWGIQGCALTEPTLRPEVGRSQLRGSLGFTTDSLQGSAKFQEVGLGAASPVTALRFQARLGETRVAIWGEHGEWSGQGELVTPLTWNGGSIEAATRVDSSLRRSRLGADVRVPLKEWGERASPSAQAWTAGLDLCMEQNHVRGDLVSLGGVTPPGVRLEIDLEFPTVAVGPWVTYRKGPWELGVWARGMSASIQGQALASRAAGLDLAWAPTPNLKWHLRLSEESLDAEAGAGAGTAEIDSRESRATLGLQLRL